VPCAQTSEYSKLCSLRNLNPGYGTQIEEHNRAYSAFVTASHAK
jgi:hypothetical protein